jgi:hypothetical protein
MQSNNDPRSSRDPYGELEFLCARGILVETIKDLNERERIIRLIQQAMEEPEVLSYRTRKAYRALLAKPPVRKV